MLVQRSSVVYHRWRRPRAGSVHAKGYEGDFVSSSDGSWVLPVASEGGGRGAASNTCSLATAPRAGGVRRAPALVGACLVARPWRPYART